MGIHVSVELDNPETWPTALLEEIDAQPSLPTMLEAAGVTERIQGHLLGQLIVAYHCTRLTEREVGNVVSGGLECLDDNMLTGKVDAAVAAGEVAPELAEEILRSHLGNCANRRGAIAFFGVRHQLRSTRRRSYYRYLLGEWGGEAIAFPLESTEYQEMLRQIGVPTVVVVQLKPQTIASTSSSSLASTLWTARHRPDEELDSMIVVGTPVSSANVKEVVQPGSEEWLELFGQDWEPFRLG